MTAKVRKRDLRTRVTYPTFDRVRTFALAHELTTYGAIERLVLLGLDAVNATATIDTNITNSIDQLSARIELLTALVDRSLFSSVVAFAYARHAALGLLDGDPRQTLDNALTQNAESAYHRQRSKALGD
ncbi:hypothetical protein [Dyella sp. S184]|uniref:hypothetical protein n=1 Tax=Dyella sp. S184 TaxID=1641862 RepID=UPI00131E1AAE|nr:hypothetical protein [Dyella sp. S184]